PRIGLRVHARLVDWSRTMNVKALGTVLCWLAALALGGSASAQDLRRLEGEGAPTDVQEEVESRVPVVLEGFVSNPDGSPAEGAVVVSSAGGKAVADVRGWYQLEAPVPLEAESVQVTAVGT